MSQLDLWALLAAPVPVDPRLPLLPDGWAWAGATATADVSGCACRVFEWPHEDGQPDGWGWHVSMPTPAFADPSWQRIQQRRDACPMAEAITEAVGMAGHLVATYEGLRSRVAVDMAARPAWAAAVAKRSPRYTAWWQGVAA